MFASRNLRSDVREVQSPRVGGVSEEVISSFLGTFGESRQVTGRTYFGPVKYNKGKKHASQKRRSNARKTSIRAKRRRKASK